MDRPPTSAPRPYIEPSTPPAPVTPPPAAPRPPFFQINERVQPGDVVEVTDIDWIWTFTFNEPIRTSSMSPSPELVGRPASRHFITSSVSMTTTYQLANDHQPPKLHPENCIVQGGVVFFKGWGSDIGNGPGGARGDMRTGTVVSLRHNGQQIF